MRRTLQAQREPNPPLGTSYSSRHKRRRHRNAKDLRLTSTQTLEGFLRSNSSALSCLGITLAVFVSRKFLILPIAIALMMIQDKLAAAGLERAERLVRG